MHFKAGQHSGYADKATSTPRLPPGAPEALAVQIPAFQFVPIRRFLSQAVVVAGVRNVLFLVQRSSARGFLVV